MKYLSLVDSAVIRQYKLCYACQSFQMPKTFWAFSQSCVVLRSAIIFILITQHFQVVPRLLTTPNFKYCMSNKISNTTLNTFKLNLVDSNYKAKSRFLRFSRPTLPKASNVITLADV